MTRASCGSCLYFEGDKRGGECHRGPPTGVLAPGKNALGQLDYQPSSFFPPVTEKQWCGEYRSKAATLQNLPHEGAA